MYTDHWELVTSWIRDYKLCNLHRHIAGSLSAEFLATQYKENLPASQKFKKRYGLDPLQPNNIRSAISSSLSLVDEGWKNFEDAFNPSRFLLDNDPQFKFHERCFQQVIVDSFEQSIGMVGIRATLGCHWRKPAEFKKALEAAVNGIINGEKITSNKVRGTLILCIRKDVPSNVAMIAFQNLLAVRTEWKHLNPALSEKIYGVDSIGPEGSFDPTVNRLIYEKANANKLKIFIHIGETWEDGKLVSKLKQIQSIISLVNISYLTNPVALFVNYETLNNHIYSQHSIQELTLIRQQILSEVVRKSIILEISPSSNDILTKRKRKVEGWQFINLKDLMRQGVRILVTDDDGGIFNTDMIGEYQKLYFGMSPFGKIDVDDIQKLILDGQR